MSMRGLRAAAKAQNKPERNPGAANSFITIRLISRLTRDRRHYVRHS
jgi:hypothetical protein